MYLETIKNTQNIFYRFKVLSFINDTLTATNNQSLKDFINAYSRIVFSSRRKFICMSSIKRKRLPRSGDLSCSLQKEISQLEPYLTYNGCCSMLFVEVLVKNSFARKALCESALYEHFLSINLDFSLHLLS